MYANLRAMPAVVGILLLVPSWAVAQESATAEEVIQKTREAAEYLTKNKEAGIEAFKTTKSPFVWKSDGYVYVFDCAAGIYLAHPHRPQAIGVKLSEIIDDGGSHFGKRFCDMAGLTKGGWVEIQVTKPGEKLVLRKVAYVRSVEGTSYQVGSGIYDSTAKIEDLQKLSDAQ
ncbi:MAG TPA: cache domain-containing protein [Aestuariivirga sp.]